MSEVFSETFKEGWIKLNGRTWQGPGRGFRVHLWPQIFRIQCAGMTGLEQNRLIDLALTFDCPLYDLASKTRYGD
jgi:hypothetical protein